MKIYEYDNYKDFKTVIDKIDNQKELELADNMLEKVLTLKKMQAEIDRLEEDLSQRETAMFYFFAMKMDEQEVVFAKEKLVSKIKRLKKKNKKEDNNEQK